MPIVEFSSFGNGLRPEQLSRGKFIANVDHDNEPAWVQYVDSLNILKR